MFINYTIPDKYFKYSLPEITDYMGAEGEGLLYKVSPEEAFEIEGDYLIVSLLSPWIRGFDSPYTADQLKLVSVDLNSRSVKAQVIN